MSTITVYNYDTDDLRSIFFLTTASTISSQSSTQFVIANPVSIIPANLHYIGTFTTSSGNITGGTITELKVEDSSGTLYADITGLNIPLTSTGYSLSFQSGSFFGPGSTYVDATGSSVLTGYGNDTYVTSHNTTILPGGGLNTIEAKGSGVRVLFNGSFSDYTLAAASGGAIWVEDSTPTRNGYDLISGSAQLKFEGDSTIIQDNSGVLTMSIGAAQAGQFAGSSLVSSVSVTDSAANVATYLNNLEALFTAGTLSGISLTDSGTPVLQISAQQLQKDAGALSAISSAYNLTVTGVSVASAASILTGGHVLSVAISDSAANIGADLDGLQGLTVAGKVSSITPTDSGTPTLSIADNQLSKDVTALAHISGTFLISANAGTANLTTGGLAGHATVLEFTGASTQYSLTPAGDGINFTVGSATGTDHLHAITQLAFADKTDTVAANSSLNEYVALLYQAALGRTPDPAGLQSWENIANALPSATQAMGVYALSDQSGGYSGSLSIAGGFTQSAEFVAKYGSLSNTQFVTQLYANVLDRAPDSGGLNSWLAELTSGQTREHVLIGFAESAEAISNAQNGFTGQSGAHAAWLFLI